MKLIEGMSLEDKSARSKSRKKSSARDNKSTTTKKTKITKFTYENVEEEVTLILQDYGKSFSV